MKKFGWCYVGCGGIANTTAKEIVKSEIERGLENTYTMWMHDPDGNRFEIMEYTPESYQVVGHTR
jgi:hypothetical protein